MSIAIVSERWVTSEGGAVRVDRCPTDGVSVWIYGNLSRIGSRLGWARVFHLPARRPIDIPGAIESAVEFCNKNYRAV